MAKVTNKDEEPTIVEEVVKKTRATKKFPKVGTVANCSLLNLREAPSTSSNVIRCLIVGTKVDILGEDGDFYKISEGFVMKQFIDC